MFNTEHLFIIPFLHERQKKSPGNYRGMICLEHSYRITRPDRSLYATTMLY